MTPMVMPIFSKICANNMAGVADDDQRTKESLGVLSDHNAAVQENEIKEDEYRSSDKPQLLCQTEKCSLFVVPNESGTALVFLIKSLAEELPGADSDTPCMAQPVLETSRPDPEVQDSVFVCPSS